MVKIMITVRNRLGITKKCIEAIKKHSTIPNQIFIYNNQTSYRMKEHFSYFCELYQKGEIAQVTFNTNESTFNAFSKAVACNMFGLQHEQDPQKDSYDFLLFLDNDVILLPEWDKKIKLMWKFIKKHNKRNIKVVGQLPGGVKPKTRIGQLEGVELCEGKLGGSGLWSVRPNFFREVGYLPIPQLVGHDKKHDQLYWKLLEKASNGEAYIMGIRDKLGLHCGAMAGSVCNRLTQNRGNPKRHKLVNFTEADQMIESMTFDEFLQKIIKDPIANKW